MPAELNPPQRAAVIHMDTPLLVLAGAGSGKTRVITRKIAWLMRQRAVDSEQIVAVTFTNKAAREMKTRVVAELANRTAARGLIVSTFHSLGLRILRRHAEALGLNPSFSIIDGADSELLVAELLREAGGQDRALAKPVRQRLSWWKNAGWLPVEIEAAAIDDSVAHVAARIYPAYQRHLAARNSVDLDDLILLPRRIFELLPDTLAEWRRRARFLLVDEYQDTNGAQYALVKQLAGAGTGLTVVGDDDQSIYAWRGAQPRNLVQLGEDFRALTVIKLEQNYRSFGRILKLANRLIAHNPRDFKKTLWSELGHGDPVPVLYGATEAQEAERVVAALARERFMRGTSYGDFAILYRGNHQARWLEQKLLEMRIPYRLSGGSSFFDRAEVRDVLAYLRLVANPRDDNALLRIANTPRRGIGVGSLEKLAALAAREGLCLAEAIDHAALDTVLKPRQAAALRRFGGWLAETVASAVGGDPVTVARALVDEIDYAAWLRDNADSEDEAERRYRNVTDLLDWLGAVRARAAPDVGLPDLLAEVLLAGILDRQEAAASGEEVSLMTLHAAKGLEFESVFIVGLEDGILPHRASIDADNIEEERRLFYVGITRARRSLYFSLARERRRHGERHASEPSRFLLELPQEDIDWEESGDKPTDRVSGKAYLNGLRALLAG